LLTFSDLSPSLGDAESYGGFSSSATEFK